MQTIQSLLTEKVGSDKKIVAQMNSKGEFDSDSLARIVPTDIDMNTLPDDWITVQADDLDELTSFRFQLAPVLGMDEANKE